MTHPKLSSLTPIDKVRLAVELDEDKPMLMFAHDGSFTLDYFVQGETFMRRKRRYDQSYDAIIPLIQKQPRAIRASIFIRCGGDGIETPSQLLDHLLIATGKAAV